MASRNRTPRGFTLVEVMVALALAGLVLLGARRLLESLADAAGGITRTAAALDREANGERLLRALVGRLEVGTERAGPFSGAERAAHFTTWCDVPAGWLERCEVTIAIDADGPGSQRLVAALPGGEVTLARGFRAGALRYLNSVDAGGEWFIGWGAGVTTPLAIGVILERDGGAGPRAAAPRADTLIVRIGARG